MFDRLEDMILSRGKLFVAILILSLTLQPALLWASPGLQEKRSQADQIAKEINSIDDRSEVAVEQYNQAQLKLGRIQQQLLETRGKLAKAEEDLRNSQNTLNRRVTGIYKGGEIIGILEVMLSARNIGDFISAIESLKQVSKHDARLLNRIKKYRLEIERAGRALAEQEKSQASTTGALQAKKNEIKARLQEREGALKKVKDEITQVENAQAAAARIVSITRAPSAPIPRLNVPASGRGAAVVRLALAELGKPYVWAAAGPSAFDCSGLTMFVYARLGVSLPHSAQAQFDMGRRVSRDQLQPGDLIYGGSGGYVSHVGIYIGGDSYVNAPRTGDVVKVSSLSARSNYVGATRP
ncbi:MAG: NlpC/P60 family protein [Actinomycetota bacterium]|nr:NlpC/P60 family protein [Actinomycetota bacterium]